MRIIKTLSFRNFFRSTYLAIASCCSFAACWILFLGLIAPFWLNIKTTVTYRHSFEPKEYVETLGMTGYVDYNGRWHNLNLMDKATNDQPFPLLFKAAQVFYISGFIVAMLSTATVILLALKPYRYFVAELATTAAFLFAGVANVLAIIFAILCLTDHSRYRLWPDQYYTIDGLTWAAFISILGALALLAALSVMVLESWKSFKDVEQVRSKPKKFLQDEPLYYKFDYNKVPKVNVEPNPILIRPYSEPSPSTHRQLYSHGYSVSSYPPTPSVHSQYSYGVQPGMLYAPPYQMPPPSYDKQSYSGHGYADSDAERSSYHVSTDERGMQMVTM